MMKNVGKRWSIQLLLIGALCLPGCSDLGSQKKVSGSGSTSTTVLQTPEGSTTPSSETASPGGPIKEEVLAE